jgi:mRNA-degrading endonuclease YafQ of YafQ-DinJ toxin-antitoxin module
MRTIKYTAQFKRDYKREKKSNKKLDNDLLPIVGFLASDQSLPLSKHDHVTVHRLSKNVIKCNFEERYVYAFL